MIHTYDTYKRHNRRRNKSYKKPNLHSDVIDNDSIIIVEIIKREIETIDSITIKYLEHEIQLGDLSLVTCSMLKTFP